MPSEKKVFISYSRADSAIVFPFVEKLQKAVGDVVWMVLDGIESGDLFIELEYAKEGMTISVKYGEYQAVIGADAEPSINKCKIHNCKGYGIWIKKRAKPSINGCEVSNNTLEDIKKEGFFNLF